MLLFGCVRNDQKRSVNEDETRVVAASVLSVPRRREGQEGQQTKDRLGWLAIGRRKEYLLDWITIKYKILSAHPRPNPV